MHQYLLDYQEWLHNYSKEDFIRMISQADFDELKQLSALRVIEAHNQYGTNSYNKTNKELKREAEEELADCIFYLYLLCKKN